MTTRRIFAIVIISVSVIVLLVGTCGIFVLYKALPHDGARHDFPLAGEGPLTNDQVISISKEVLIQEGKFSTMVRPSTLGNDPAGKPIPSIQHDASGDAFINWYEPISGRYMNVHLHRTSGKVTGALQGN